MSCRRYGEDLTQALEDLPQTDWKFQTLTSHHVEWVMKLFPSSFGVMTANRLGRFVRYPAQIRGMSGDVFHIVDHSHANLLDVLPAERTVITCHDIIPLLATKGAVPIPVSRNERLSFPGIIRRLERCQAVISVSESTKRNLLEHTAVREERIHVVHSGVNPKFTPHSNTGLTRLQEREALLKKHSIPQGAKVLLHVGTTGRYKNTPALIRMLEELRKIPELGDQVWLLRVGVPFDTDVQALIESLGVRERLVEAGRVEGDDALAMYYRCADVFVFPSLWEGFGWPPLEAMACGTPSVVSNVASLPEIAGDAALLVDPQDIAGLVAATSSLLTDPEKHARYCQLALEHAQRFTWERCARQILKVYEKVVHDQGKH